MLNRREFLGGAACAGAALGLGCVTRRSAPAGGFSPNYWCTWGIQNALVRVDRKRGMSAIAGDQGAFAARNNLNEEFIFGKGGWAETQFPNVHADLFMMLDDGWDVPYDVHPAKNLAVFGSHDPHPSRFPSFGSTAVERLTNVNRRLQDAGWQGAGLWVACQTVGDGKWLGRTAPIAPGVRDVWKRKLDESAAAGVRYWKVDWGAHGGSTAYRQMISELKREIYPELVVEHMPHSGSVFNGQDFRRLDSDGNPTGCGRLLGNAALAHGADEDNMRRFGFSDVLRVYDMLQPVEGATCFERTAYYAALLEKAGARTILNLEGNVVLGAALGHAFGVMRSCGMPPPPAKDVSQLALRLAEVDRAVRWQRLAPAFGGRSDCRTTHSDETLTDWNRFQSGQGWLKDAWGRIVTQRSPAAIARGCALPTVTPKEGEKPRVAVCRHPNGAVSVAALPRSIGMRYWTPRADIALACAPAANAPLAVFGETASVSLPCPARPRRVIAEDLAGGPTTDITVAADWRDGRLTLPGNLLAKIGRAQAPNDPSAPGTLVQLS